MAAQNGHIWPLGRPAYGLMIVADALRAGGEKAVAGQIEMTDVALKQATENVDALFGTLQPTVTASSSADAANLYLKFLGATSQQYTRQIKTMGAIMSRSGKEAWQLVVDAVASSSPAAVPMVPAA